MSKTASAGQRCRNVRDVIGMLTNQVFRDGKVVVVGKAVFGVLNQGPGLSFRGFCEFPENLI